MHASAAEAGRDPTGSGEGRMNDEDRGAEAPFRQDSGGSEAAMPPDAWQHLAYCPNCGSRLEKRQCKARCFRCGYFQDCSDTIV